MAGEADVQTAIYVICMRLLHNAKSVMITQWKLPLGMERCISGGQARDRQAESTGAVKSASASLRLQARQQHCSDPRKAAIRI